MEISNASTTGKTHIGGLLLWVHRIEVPIEVVADAENHIPTITIVETNQQLGEVVVTGQFAPQFYVIRCISKSCWTIKLQKGAINAQMLLNTELGVRLSNDMALGKLILNFRNERQ